MVTFTDSNNPRSNITNYSLLRDGLTRVHPGGYAALFNAALEAGVQTVTVSSCWRPMLGSIAHRAGLGLDVSVLGGTALNRQELRRALHATKNGAHGNGNDHDNVTDAEVKAFKGYEQSIAERKRAQAELLAANKALVETKSSDGETLRRARERQRNASDMLREQMRKESDKSKE